MCWKDLALRIDAVCSHRWDAVSMRHSDLGRKMQKHGKQMRIKWADVKEALRLCRCVTNLLVDTPGCFMEVRRTWVCVQIKVKYTPPRVKTNNCLLFVPLLCFRNTEHWSLSCYNCLYISMMWHQDPHCAQSFGPWCARSHNWHIVQAAVDANIAHRSSQYLWMQSTLWVNVEANL